MHAITVLPTDTADAKGRHRPGPENIVWSEVPTPAPGPGEVLVKVGAAGINRGDLLQRQGLYPPPAGITEVMGMEATGTVAELGSGVQGWSQGDEVIALVAGGAYAEYVVAPADQLLPIPSGIDRVTAATLVEVAATVVSNMDHVGLKAGETFLVHGGTGGIGQFAIQYAKSMGCRVITTCGTDAKRSFCTDLGADVALDYHDDWVAGVKEATGDAGADVILDIMGAKYLGLNVDALATNGRIVIIGMQGGSKAELNIGKLLAKRGVVTATSLRARPLEEKAAICRRVTEAVWPMYTDGRIKPAPVETFPMAKAGDAHRRLDSGEVLGKVALVL